MKSALVNFGVRPNSRSTSAKPEIDVMCERSAGLGLDHHRLLDDGLEHGGERTGDDVRRPAWRERIDHRDGTGGIVLGERRGGHQGRGCRPRAQGARTLEQAAPVDPRASIHGVLPGRAAALLLGSKSPRRTDRFRTATCRAGPCLPATSMAPRGRIVLTVRAAGQPDVARHMARRWRAWQTGTTDRPDGRPSRARTARPVNPCGRPGRAPAGRLRRAPEANRPLANGSGLRIRCPQ